MTTKESICSDLHNILYRLDLQSADSWQMRVDMAKVLLSAHGVKGNAESERKYMDGAQFLFANCSYIQYNETEFEFVAKKRLDFDTWESDQSKIAVFGEVIKEAIADYQVTAVAEQKDDMILVTPQPPIEFHLLDC